MESEKKGFAMTIEGKQRLFYDILIFFTGLMVFIFSFLGGKNYELILRNTIVSVMIAGTVFFMMLDADKRGNDGFSYDNYEHKIRFVLVYAAMIILSCAFSLVPDMFWPYLSIFVILALFSNNEIGMISGTGFVMISVMLQENGSYGELFMYMLAGIIAIILFKDLTENTVIGYPVAISLMLQAVLLMAYDILFQNRTLSFNLFILPIINIMLNLIILMAFLNMFGIYIIRKSNDNYMEINDSGFHLLTKLKENNKDEYFRAVHTAYLAERIAIDLGLNDRAVKNCSYYHRIGIIDGKQDWESLNQIYKDNNFPAEAIALLQEYIEAPKDRIKSKECLAVNLSETVIASIMYLFKKNKNANINYEQMIDKIFEKKEENGELLNYNITFREYEQMKKILKKEKLYYDFLR